MQKQLKILDEQLNSNNLTRVPSSVNKSEKSLFRALSLSIYFNEDHIDQIIRILRLCLASTCKISSSSPSSFSSPQKKSRFLAKFSNNQGAIDMYIKEPEAGCFVYDNLQLASLAFQKRVLLFTVTKDGYLQQNLFTACTKTTKDPPLMVARISNRFFCVQSQPTRSVMMFIKENIINQLLNLEDKKANDDIFFYSDGCEKVHKKSLSDCGEIMPFKLVSEDKNLQYYGNGNGQLSNPGQIDHFMHPNYTNEQYEEFYMLSEMKSETVLPNERYSGRLKFFDQTGNYGFIVVDGFGSDLFVHFDDIQKAGIGKQKLVNIRNNEQMRFQFTCLQYDGKYKKSKKAVDLKQIPNDY